MEEEEEERRVGASISGRRAEEEDQGFAPRRGSSSRSIQQPWQYVIRRLVVFGSSSSQHRRQCWKEGCFSSLPPCARTWREKTRGVVGWRAILVWGTQTRRKRRREGKKVLPPPLLLPITLWLLCSNYTRACMICLRMKSLQSHTACSTVRQN